MEISMLGRPKWFISIGISIAAMAMSTFNTVWITQLDTEIHTLKAKTDLMLDVVHLHETGTDMNSTGRPTWIQYLVLLQSDQCHQENVRIHDSSSQKHSQIGTALLISNWSPSPWCLGRHHFSCYGSCCQIEFGLFRTFRIGPFSNWGLSPRHCSNQQIHANPSCPNGIQFQSLGPVQVPSTANPHQLCIKYLLCTGHRSHQSSYHQPFKIISNYFQLWPAFLFSPQGHILLQGKEGDGNQFEKIISSSTIPGQLRYNPIQLPVQDCRSHRENCQIIRKHLDNVLHQDH